MQENDIIETERYEDIAWLVVLSRAHPGAIERGCFLS